MVENILVERWIEVGEMLTQTLEEAEFPLVASFWLYTDESGRWRLMLASPLVDQKGPLKAYEKIQKVLRRKPELKPLTLSDISVVSPKYDLVKDLRIVFGVAKDVRGVRLQGTRVNEHFVEGAYLYRLKRRIPNSSQSKARRVGTMRLATHRSRAASG